VAERRFLQPLPPLPEPFDQVASRRVGGDCVVHFEARQYSVPFARVGQHVEQRGSAGIVQVLGGGWIIATHARHSATRVVIDPAHFEGESTERVVAPMPLGGMGRRLISGIWPTMRSAS
jgi:hypothetical protein